MLLQIPKVLDDKELARARQLLVDAPWSDGRHSAGSQAAQVKNNQQLAHDCKVGAAVRSLVVQALDRNTLFFSAALPKRVMPPQFNRYGDATNHYGAHVDNAIRFAPDTRLRVRTDLSATLFLSNPDSYDGGELLIGEGAETRSIKLPAGDMVLYPANSVHQVQPVVRGHRIASFFWVESMVRLREQRELLFRLDMAILALRAKHGESDEAVQLTGTYHNLLRLWADT